MGTSETTPTPKSNRYSALSNDEFVTHLKSKSIEDEWKVSELLEVERRGDSILDREPQLQSKFGGYESELRKKLDIVKNRRENASSMFSFTAIPNPANYKLVGLPTIQSVADAMKVNDEIIDFQRRAAKIGSFVNESTDPSYLKASEAAINSLNQQAAEISSILANSGYLKFFNASQTSINSVKKQAGEISEFASTAAKISLSQPTSELILNSLEVIAAARRSADTLQGIPTLLSRSQMAFFEIARKEPISLLPSSSDDLNISAVIGSGEFENVIEAKVENELARVIDRVVYTSSITLESKTDQKRIIELLEKNDQRETEKFESDKKENTFFAPKNIIPNVLTLIFGIVAVVEYFHPRTK